MASEGSPRTASFVYVGHADSNEISVLQLDRRHGDLTGVETVPIPGIAQPGISTPMVVSPDRQFLYVGMRGQPQVVVSFAIDPASGTLRYLASGPLADSMAYPATDRTGRFLLGASYPGHKLTVNPIDPPGIVHPPQQVLLNYPIVAIKCKCCRTYYACSQCHEQEAGPPAPVCSTQKGVR